MTPESIAALVILVLTYVGVAVGRIPGLRLDRAGIAFLGGAAMIALGPLNLVGQAWLGVSRASAAAGQSGVTSLWLVRERVHRVRGGQSGCAGQMCTSHTWPAQTRKSIELNCNRRINS